MSVAAKLVPSQLLLGQKDNYVSVCQDLQERLEQDPGFLTEIIT